jgi:hypothetical protein
LGEIETLFVSCTFGQAFHPSKDVPVCQIFNDEEIKILEFREDLEYFWQDGYGFEINSKPGCVLMKDVVDNFEKVLEVKVFHVSRPILVIDHFNSLFFFLSFRDNVNWRTTKEVF